MIAVARDRVADDGTVIEPPSSWFEEAEAETANAIAEGRGHQVTDLYKGDRLRSALEELFRFKCAYCESTIGPANGMDVEHFRPKGRVRERRDHPGYYWLAYTWENLYPACQLCNQRREDKPLHDDDTTLPSAGKADQFPIADESQRAMTPDDPIASEAPLLLDPNADDPERYLVFDLTGEALARDPQNTRASKTIEICHLNRRRLVRARRRRLQEVKASVTENGSEFPDATREQLLAAARRTFVKPGSPYSACIRAALDSPEAFGWRVRASGPAEVS